MHSTIAAEQIDGDTFATWETDGRGLTVGSVYLTSAESEAEARAIFVTASIRALADRIRRDGSISGEGVA